MNTILQAIDAAEFDVATFVKFSVVLLLGTLLTGLFGHFVFGKRSTLNQSVSSAIGIIFIYATMILIPHFANEFSSIIAPLPYVAIANDQIILFQFRDIHYSLLCNELLRMVILTFLVNLIDGWMPKGGNVFTWLIFRALTVIIAFVLHYIVWLLITTYIPQNIMQYTPAILLAILALLLLTGVMKIIIGALLIAVSPIISGLYTFFFANIIGKQIMKAVITTALLTTLFFILSEISVTVITISQTALMAYIPFFPLLFIIWYLVYRIL